MLSDDIIITTVIIVIFLYIGITIKVFKLSLRVSFVSHQKSVFIQAEKTFFPSLVPHHHHQYYYNQVLLYDEEDEEK